VINDYTMLLSPIRRIRPGSREWSQRTTCSCLCAIRIVVMNRWWWRWWSPGNLYNVGRCSGVTTGVPSSGLQLRQLSLITGTLLLWISAHLIVLLLSSPVLNLTFLLLPITSSHSHASASFSTFDYWRYINFALTLREGRSAFENRDIISIFD